MRTKPIRADISCIEAIKIGGRHLPLGDFNGDRFLDLAMTNTAGHAVVRTKTCYFSEVMTGALVGKFTADLGDA